MKTNYNFLPYDDQNEDGYIYDGGDSSQLNSIEEYGNDEYNFYPDASF